MNYLVGQIIKYILLMELLLPIILLVVQILMHVTMIQVLLLMMDHVGITMQVVNVLMAKVLK